MRGAWMWLLVASACAPAPAKRPEAASTTASASATAPCGPEAATVVGRIAYARDGGAENWLEIETRGPSCNALAACRRLVAIESEHGLPPGFSARVQQPCRANAAADALAVSSLPYELVDSESAESDDASVRARYSWIERFARADACEASRDAHEARRKREAVEMRKALGAAAAAPATGDANELACRRVLGGD